MVLTVDNTPKYEALSYAWGSAENPSSVDIGANAVLSITQDLATALPYLRHETQARVFWIDAICVNQQDLKERSQQVERMRDIFSLADRVVVWLGPETHDSTSALSTLQAVSSEFEYVWNQWEVKRVSRKNPAL